MLEQPSHVGVGGVDLVDDEQVAQKTGGTQVCVLQLHRSQQRLVDRAHRDRACEESFGPFGGPV